MDFRSRGVQTPIAQAASTSSVGSQDSGKKGLTKLFSKGPILLLVLIALIIAAVAAFMAFGGGGQAKLVEKDRYQAVFLNNGQVYFGHIKDLNDKYVNLDSIYYLQTNNGSTDTTAAANQNVTLVKLGCELHGPYDQMVVNADQVLFWENLKDDSQVVTKIAEYKKTNPKNECTAAAANGTTNQAAPNAGTQSTGNTGTSTQPSSNSGSGTGTGTTPRQP